MLSHVRRLLGWKDRYWRTSNFRNLLLPDSSSGLQSGPQDGDSEVEWLASSRKWDILPSMNVIELFQHQVVFPYGVIRRVSAPVSWYPFPHSIFSLTPKFHLHFPVWLSFYSFY